MEISPRYNPRQVEEKTLKKWLEKESFSAGVNTKFEPFSIVIPPPNITGILHMGHALNNTLQDVLIRFARLRQYETLWMPGTDHAGIATQNVVEKNLAKEGLKKEDIGRDEFIKKLWAWENKYGSTIVDQLKKLGASCDWRRTRFTMDEAYSHAVGEVFVSLWDKGLIYQGDYIINWCPRCQTALADEEAPYEEKEGFLYYIKYPFKDSGEFVTVATTRPETMLGDTAVAVNPKDKRYKSLGNKTIILPLIEREIPIVKDDFVDPEFGAGAVKVTPAHDPNDFEIGRRHNLPFVLVMHPDGTMNKAAGKFSGMDRFQAREAIVDALKEKNLMLKVEPHTHTLGHCYRCHTVVEPYLSRQWFVKMKPLAKPAIAAVKKGEIKFYPPRWKKVYLNWMENIHDWCVSRQIWWGHRLPVYYCKKCQDNTNEKSAIRNTKYATRRITSGERRDTQRASPAGTIVSRTRPEKCPACGATDIYQDQDVLDTWFSSWLWPFATFGWPFGQTKDQRPKTKDIEEKIWEAKEAKKELAYFYPTNVLVTAPEIIFFWVARMIMAGFEFLGKKPFRDVYIHGTVRDSSGKKMSKSLGNIIDPLEIIDKFGADSLRFSLMLLAAGGADIYLSDDKFLVGRNFANKIWNAARFLLLRVKENGIAINNLNWNELSGPDQWVLSQLNQTIDSVTRNLENYRINEAVKTIYDFFWHVFCDWYIEITKDNFTVNKAKISLYLLISSVKLIHPVMPFITEEIFSLIKQYSSLPLEDSIMKSAWPDKYNGRLKKQEIKKIETLIATIKEVRNIKNDLGLGMKKIKLEINAKGENENFWQLNQTWIQRLTFSSALEFKKDLSRVLYKNELWELDLDIEDIAVDNFLSSLDKKIKAAEGILQKLSQRLNNKNFLAAAAKETINRDKEKLKELTDQANRLRELKDAFVKSNHQSKFSRGKF